MFAARKRIWKRGHVSKFNMADQRIQRRSNKKKLLVLLVMLLDDEEYKHVERRCFTQQWVSRREERGAYYAIFKELAIEDSGGFAECMGMAHCSLIG